MTRLTLVKQRSITQAYLEKIDPIIKSKARHYSIKGMEREDMMQEGRLAALEALTRWQEKPGKANITSWAWIYIDTRFKQLAKKAPNCEETVEDIAMVADHNAFKAQRENETWEASWLDRMLPWTPLQVEILLDYVTEIESDKELREELFESLMRAMPANRRVIRTIIEDNLALAASATRMTVSKQRICQLQKKVTKNKL